MEINIGEKKIRNNNLIYFIAEIGVNHCVFQGSVLSTVPKVFKGLYLWKIYNLVALFAKFANKLTKKPVSLLLTNYESSFNSALR